MKLAIDSYCYHRYFGEVYPGIQTDPGRRMTVWDFLKRARKHGVEGVSLESCYLPSFEDDFLLRLRDTLDEYGLERVWAWGHPDGLHSGTDRAAARDLVRHLDYARKIGATVMRIVGGSWRSRPPSWAVHKRRLLTMLKGMVGEAEEHGVVLAIENHIDMLGHQVADLITTVDSPWLGVCLDTGNNLRLFEDPLMVAGLLAPWARATHIKDISVLPGDPKEFAFWPSVPLGDGLVDIAKVVGFLRQAGYDGLLAIEVDFLHPKYPDEDSAVAKSVNYLRSALGRKGSRGKTR
ncbi:MAG TPA: sugar phosphate isomerase/epimerase family protein [Gemmataceae bacterium]|jgi:sugar phosphate isomerase/epimerase|nr:sugar phosphate isomerase/epimerase family protein [Gemmataceae bacterium]